MFSVVELFFMCCNKIFVYTLRLSGTSPFVATDFKELISKNAKCNIEYPECFWEGITSDARDLVMRMVDKNPATRISAHDALEHCWINKEFHATSALSTAIQNLKAYTSTA